MNSIESLKIKIENLSKFAGDLSQIEPDIIYEKGAWTALKDAFLFSYIRNVYTPIIKNYFDNFYYIDFCAGPGLVKIDNDVILGSPIIAAIAHEIPFTKMFFLEQNTEKAKALKLRLKRLKEFSEFENINYEVIEGDCNKTFDKVIKKMNSKKGRHHRLAFFDPEGMEINYATYSKCLEMYTDLIFNFQTPGIFREVSCANKFPDRERQRLSKMFGENEIWKECDSREKLLNSFENLLCDTYRKTNKPISRSVKIDSGQSYIYHLIFLTRYTRGNSPWIKSVDRLKKETEENTGKLVKHALDVFKGRATNLDMFISDDELKILYPK